MVTRTIGVIAAASMLTLLFSQVETTALGGGLASADAFLKGYSMVFSVAATAAVFGAVLALLLYRPK